MTPGTLIAEKYRLRALIGEGAMGVVWAAINERTEREVALKLINGENDGLRRRLLREARACGRLVHRNIIEILDVGETLEGEPFLVMPLLWGETLADRLKRDGLLPPPLAARIAADVARGLATAHAAGIIHRDLKPANVFLHREAGSEDDFVIKVLDFGVSKMVPGLGTGDAAGSTMTGGAVGSPLYMSPEQALGDAGVGPQADLWAVGVLLFEMLTGTRPFYGATAFAVVAQILRGPIPTVVERAPGVDPALGEVVARCLIRRPAERMGSAAELATLLEPFAGAREHGAPSAPLPARISDEDEPTSFFRKPKERAAADEMLAAADVLASADPLTSADLLASAPIEGTAPLPEERAPESAAPPSPREPMASSTKPLVQPDGLADEEADVDRELQLLRPRRAKLWVGLALVLASGLAGGLYLTAPPNTPVGAARAPATIRLQSSPPPPSLPSASPPAADRASPDPPPTTEPSVAPAAAGATASATASASAPVRPKPAGPSRSPSAPVPRSGGKIIRETPF